MALMLETPDATVVTSSRSAAPSFYAPELDALRFLAFLLVFGRHVVTGFGLHLTAAAGQTAKVAQTASHEALSPFWIVARGMAEPLDFGVCLFFFLSSYLITRLLMIERTKTGTVAVRDFYIRRSLRIWPLYFSFLLFMLLVSHLSPALYVSWPRVIASALFLGNWPVVLHGWVGSPIEPLWSVSVEEQFYLVWPNIARYGRRGILAISAIMAATSLGTLVYFGLQGGGDMTRVWANTFVQSLLFAGGAVAGTYLRPETYFIRSLYRVAMLVGGFALWILASSACHVVRAVTPGAVDLVVGYLLMLVGTILIFLSIAGWRSLKLPKALPYLGKISYGLYVFHVLFLRLSMIATEQALLLLKIGHMPLLLVHLFSAVVALALTIACAAVSYRLIEASFLKLKTRFTAVQSRPV